MKRFTDMSALEAVDLIFKYVFHVALYRRLAWLGQETIKSAFLVPNPAVARYIKLHALVTDHSPLKVAMFEEHAVAAKSRIIFISGRDDPTVRQVALDAGAFGFLSKPFDDEALLQLVRKALVA